jgi:hypothetical protein
MHSDNSNSWISIELEDNLLCDPVFNIIGAFCWRRPECAERSNPFAPLDLVDNCLYNGPFTNLRAFCWQET